MARTERESDNKRREEKRNGRLVGVTETSNERVDWRRLQRRNWNILGLPKTKEWPQCHTESSWQERRADLTKRKKNRAVCPEYQFTRGKRVKMGDSRTLARVRAIRARAWRGKGRLHGERGQIPRRKGRESNKRLPRTSRRKHERVSALQDDLQSLGFPPSLAKPEIGNEVGRRRASS